MSLVAVGSAKGSPGATTLVAALGSVWPASAGVLLAELDPAGGDLAIRLGLPAEPGLVTLAAEGRRGVTPELVWEHTSSFPGSEVAHVLAGPASADQATAALAAVGGKLAEVLAGLADVDVLADCGRLDPGSPALAVARRADLVVVVARSSVAEIRHLSTRLAALRLRAPVALVLVGDRPYGVSEVAGAVGVEALGAVAHDARGAEVVSAGTANGSRLLRTSPFMRTTRSLAETLVARLGPPATPTAQPAVWADGAEHGAPWATERAVAGDRVEGPAAGTDAPEAPSEGPVPAAATDVPEAGPDDPVLAADAAGVPEPATPASEAAGPLGAGEAPAEAPAPAGGRQSPTGRPRRARPLRPRRPAADSQGSADHDAGVGAHDRGGDR
ncbi:MAG: hypothetical protein KY447_10720 [Actinobacteria bacterium]|nr:hypothetical protein [Actinomycetota bacterium]